MIRAAFVAEGSQQVGTGHVAETLALVNECQIFDIKPLVWLSREVPDSLRNRFGASLQFPEWAANESLEEIAAAVKGAAAEVIVTNLRSITAEQVNALGSTGVPVVCLDELGSRPLPAAAVINNSVVEDFWNYGEAPKSLFLGADYMCLGPEYRQVPKPRMFAHGVRHLAVSMGGADRTRATLRIMDALSAWRPEVEVEVVVGVGFDFRREILTRSDIARFTIHDAPASLASILAGADVGVTAGGNTLYEMARLGTPAIVLHEDPHEAKQGHIFAAAGAALWPGGGADVAGSDIVDALTSLGPIELQTMSAAGQKLVDGEGVERVLTILRDAAKEYGSITGERETNGHDSRHER